MTRRRTADVCMTNGIHFADDASSLARELASRPPMFEKVHISNISVPQGMNRMRSSKSQPGAIPSAGFSKGILEGMIGSEDLRGSIVFAVIFKEHS